MLAYAHDMAFPFCEQDAGSIVPHRKSYGPMPSLGTGCILIHCIKWHACTHACSLPAEPGIGIPGMMASVLQLLKRSCGGSILREVLMVSQS